MAAKSPTRRYRVKFAERPQDYGRNWLVMPHGEKADGMAIAATYTKAVAQKIARALNTSPRSGRTT